jgi:hypothetical protein
MAEYPYPDPVVQVADARELARDLVVIPNRRVQLVPNIGIIGGTHSVLVIETGIGPRNAEKVLEFAAYQRGLLACASQFRIPPEQVPAWFAGAVGDRNRRHGSPPARVVLRWMHC